MVGRVTVRVAPRQLQRLLDELNALQVGILLGKIDKDLLVQDAFEKPLDQRGGVLALVEGRIVLGYDLINAEHFDSILHCDR